MTTKIYAFLAIAFIVFSYETAFGENKLSTSQKNEVSRATAENEMQIEIKKTEEQKRAAASSEEKAARRESLIGVKGRY